MIAHIQSINIPLVMLKCQQASAQHTDSQKISCEYVIVICVYTEK